MLNVNEGQVLVAERGVPRATVAAATATLYRWSETGKYHAGSGCRQIKGMGRHTRMGAYSVTADRLVASRTCVCLGRYAPRGYEALLEPVRAIADLDTATATLARQLADGALLDLPAVSVLRQGLADLPVLRREISAALVGSRAALRPTAVWVSGITRRARAVAAAVDAALLSDPGRTARAAAAALMPQLVAFHRPEHQATRVERGVVGWLVRDVQELLEELVARGTGRAQIVEQVAACVEAQRPTEIAQLPQALLPPPGVPLGEAVLWCWRRAARAEVSAMLEAYLDEYDRLAAKTAPRLLVTVPIDLRASEVAPLLLGAPSVTLPAQGDGRGAQVWLVPEVVADAVAASRYVRTLHPGADLPEGLDLREPGAVSRLLAGHYVTFLGRLIQEMPAEAAQAAALAVATPAPEAPSAA